MGLRCWRRNCALKTTTTSDGTRENATGTAVLYPCRYYPVQRQAKLFSTTSCERTSVLLLPNDLQVVQFASRYSRACSILSPTCIILYREKDDLRKRREACSIKFRKMRGVDHVRSRRVASARRLTI